MADYGLYSHAWVEVGVASTKNVIAQVAVLLMVSLSLGLKRDMQISEARDIIAELWSLPDRISDTLMQAPHIKKLAEKYSKYNDMFVLGRNYFFPVAGEASTMVFNPMGKFYSKTISNIQEVVAREGPILWYISATDTHKELYTDTIELPDTSELLSIFTWLTASYLFALYLAEDLGRDVDKPRNLAKSVTVE